MALDLKMIKFDRNQTDTQEKSPICPYETVVLPAPTKPVFGEKLNFLTVLNCVLWNLIRHFKLRFLCNHSSQQNIIVMDEISIKTAFYRHQSLIYRPNSLEMRVC